MAKIRFITNKYQDFMWPNELLTVSVNCLPMSFPNTTPNALHMNNAIGKQSTKT